MTFALVGPPQVRRVAARRRARTSSCSASKPHAELPRYVHEFDVGLVPYRISEYTANVYPTKLNEYLSMGMPVVATDLVEIRRFNAEHGELVAIAARRRRRLPRRFARDRSRSPTPADVARRIEVARSNSWDRRIAAMSALIDEASSERAASTQRLGRPAARAYTARRGGARPQIVVALAVAYLLLFQTPLVWWLAEPLQLVERRRDRPMRSSCLPAASASRARPAAATRSASSRRSICISAGYAPRMIFSSGFVFALPGSRSDEGAGDGQRRARRTRSCSRRRPPTPTRTSTLLAVRSSTQHGWRRVLLVSSPYHMRRAMLTWQQASRRRSTVIADAGARRASSTLHERGASLDQIRGIAAGVRGDRRCTGGAAGSDARGSRKLLTRAADRADRCAGVAVSDRLIEAWVRLRLGRHARHAGLLRQRSACAASGWRPATTAGSPACRSRINALGFRDRTRLRRSRSRRARFASSSSAIR